MIAKNTFEGGLNSDDHLKKLPRQFYVEGQNIEVMEDGEYGAIVRIEGTKFRTVLVDGCPPGFVILNSIASRSNCGPGVVFFLYDNVNGGQIKFFNHEQLYKLSDADFGPDDFVDVDVYSNNDVHYVYFTNGVMPLKLVEIDCINPKTARNVRKPTTTDCIKFERVETGGAISSSSVIALYRYFNSETCLYSEWSNHSMAVPVLNDDRGGAIGEPTDKKIVFSIEGDGEGYDSVQLLVIRNDKGNKDGVLVGYLSSPSKVFYDNKQIIYTGLENEIQVDLSEYLIDDAAILTSASLTIGDNRLFLGNVELRDLSGDPTIGKAKTIRRKIPGEYEAEKESVESRSEFRSETIAYGIYYYDEFGNGAVFPLDLSCFGTDFVDIKDAGTMEVIGLDSRQFDEIDYAIASFTGNLEVGDYVGLDGKVGRIIFISGTSMLIDNADGAWNVGDQGTYDILLGKGGNNQDSWVWTYPERKDIKFTLFDEDQDINAIGLRLEGITNHPEWAVGYEIVRGERIKNILGQSPHIPLIGAQGSPTSYRLEQIVDFKGDPLNDRVDFFSDYDGSMDYICPKSFKLGAARNLINKSYLREIEDEEKRYEHISEWILQLVSDKKVIFGGGDGDEEAPKAISVVPGEYMHNVNGESFDWSLGTQVRIVDAVVFDYEKKHSSLIDEIPNKFYVTVSGPGTTIFLPFMLDLENVSAHVFSTKGNNFVYNRSGSCLYQEATVLKPYMELDVFVDTLYKMDYDFRIVQSSGISTLPKYPFGERILQDLIKFGGHTELSEQQFQQDPVPPEMLQWFNKASRTQRQVVLGLDKEMKDFAYLLEDAARKFQLNMVPFSSWVPEPTVINNDRVRYTLADMFDHVPPENLDDINPQYRTDWEGRNIRTQEVVGSGRVLGGSFILNIEKGIGADRYGSFDDPNVNWCRTGMCGKITSTDQIINADLFAGDCFISKHAYKVNETIPQPLSFVPLHFKLGVEDGKKFEIDDLGFGFLMTKTGHAKRNIEILEVYLESEINANFERKIDQYPKLNDDKLSTYDGEWTYSYNPALSDLSCVKPLVTRSLAKSNPLLKTAVWYSDIAIRGGTSNSFVDVDGFSSFKANNFFLFSEEYGKIMKIISLDDKALHVFQEDKIGFVPIGIDELSTVDGQVIATGTANVFGSGDYYIQRDVGCQNPLTIVERDGVLYGVDARRKTVFSFASRGSGFKLISEDKNNTRLEAFIGGNLQGHIDTAKERYVISNGESSIHYNIRRGVWELTMDEVYHGVGDGEKMLWVQGMDLYSAYDGLQIFGKDKEGYLKVILNPDVDLSKIFQVLQFNVDGIVEAKLSVLNEDGTTQEGIRQKVVFRNHDHFINSLRDKNNRRSKLRGHVGILEIWLPPGVRMNSIVTTYRKSY